MSRLTGHFLFWLSTFSQKGISLQKPISQTPGIPMLSLIIFSHLKNHALLR